MQATSSNFTFSKRGLEEVARNPLNRVEKRRMRSAKDLAKRHGPARSQVLKPKDRRLNLKHAPMSTTGWMGTKANEPNLGTVRRAWTSGKLLDTLRGFTLVPFR